MYLYDYHMHSQNSSDGKNSVTDMCIKAISAGLKEIAVTDHFEPIGGNEKYPYYMPGSYFFDIMKAKTIFSGRLEIKCGVELGQPHMYPEYSLKLIESHPYDYVLASVHRTRDNEDFGMVVYNQENISGYCEKYLEELRLLARWNKFDCVGHLDLVKRYASKYGVKVKLVDYDDKLEEILRILIRNGKGIEVNTSGLRQHAGESLPGFDIIRMYRQLGGEIITVGSDAHRAADVGKGIKDTIETIKHAGFDFMTVYTKRQPTMVKISDKPSVYSFAKKLA